MYSIAFLGRTVPAIELVGFPLLSYVMSWGPWTWPANLMIQFIVVLTVVVCEFRKRTEPQFASHFRLAQAFATWTLCLLMGFAERFGEFVGP